MAEAELDLTLPPTIALISEVSIKSASSLPSASKPVSAALARAFFWTLVSGFLFTFFCGNFFTLGFGLTIGLGLGFGLTTLGLGFSLSSQE